VGKSTTIGVDLAKSVFEIAISKEPGRVSQRRRVSRSQMARLMADQAPSMVLMEACGSAHYWGRVFESQGHAVRLLPAHHVSRYRLGNKTDRADVDALLEAGRNERIFPVPVKSVAQQTLTALHRLRCEWVATRTARLNGLRGLLREIGIVIPRGARRVLPAVGDALRTGQVAQELHIPMMACCEEIRGLEERIGQVERQLATIAKESCAVESLLSVPGIGLLTATAMIGLVGSADRFRSGRRYASFLGLVPREFSSGNTRRLGAIS
jgi:transposase